MSNNRELKITIHKIEIKIVRITQANNNYYFESYRYNEDMDKWGPIGQYWDLEEAKKEAERIKSEEIIKAEVVEEYK